MDWVDQRRHLRVQNLFYSAVYGENDRGLVDLDYRVAGEYTIAENVKRDARCQPAFTLYNGENLLFVDFVMPGRITDEEISRLSQYNRLDREAVEDYMDRCNFSREENRTSRLSNYDFFYVMPKQQYQDHISGSPKRQKKMDRLQTEGCIVTVSPGEYVAKASGSIHGSNIDDQLGQGISIPLNTGKYVHLPLNVEPESLAVAICEEIVAGGDLRGSGVKLRESDVGDHFGRVVGRDIAHRVLEYLRKINACRVKRGEDCYTFTKYDLDVVLSIRNQLEAKPIDEVLSDKEPDENLTSLDDFF